MFYIYFEGNYKIKIERAWIVCVIRIYWDIIMESASFRGGGEQSFGQHLRHRRKRLLVLGKGR